jgi:hypothetical protein
MELTLELVREWLAANKAQDTVKAFLKELGAGPALGADTVGPWLETEDGKKLVQPYVDKRVTDAIKTHDTKTKETTEAEVKRRVAEELLKANPQETPQDKQIRELREQMDADRKESARDKLKRAIVEEAAAQGVPSWWVDEYSGNTIEEAKLFVAKVKKHNEELTTKAKNEVLTTGFKPGSGNGTDKTKKDVSKLSLAEAIAMEEAGELNKHIPTN